MTALKTHGRCFYAHDGLMVFSGNKDQDIGARNIGNLSMNRLGTADMT